MDLLASLLVAVVVGAVLWASIVVVLWLHRPSRDLVLPVLRALPDVARLARNVLRDSSTPRSVKLALALLVAWLVSPIDLIPDFIPVLGTIDDVIVAAIVLRWVARRIGRERLRANWTGSADSWRVVERLL